MTGRHPRFSLLDSEVEGWLSDEIACGNGLRDATVDPLLSATVLTPELCRGGADLPDNRRAAQESYGSHPTSAGVRHYDSARDDYPVPRLSAATTTPRPLWGPGSAILAGNQSAARESHGSYHPTPAGVPHGVGGRNASCDHLPSPRAATRSCPPGLGRSNPADMFAKEELRRSSSAPDPAVYEPPGSSGAAVASFAGAFAPRTYPTTQTSQAVTARAHVACLTPALSREEPPLPSAAVDLAQALINAVRAQPSVRPNSSLGSLRIPEYGGYSDRMSATEYLEALHRYQEASGMDDSVIIGRVLPISLTAQAARWYRLVGRDARTMGEFEALFRSEFLPPDYERRMLNELEMRTQHRDESLLEYVRAMQELFLLAKPMASEAEKVERVTRQAHPTFAAYLRGSQFANLNELASEAKRIQADILAARSYRPPPPAHATLEPRCAWQGASPPPMPRAAATAAYAESTEIEPRDVSERALDPYSYAMRARSDAQQGMPRHGYGRGQNAHEEPNSYARVESSRGPNAQRDSQGAVAHSEPNRYARVASQGNQPALRGQRPPAAQSHRGIVCYKCRATGHYARACTAPCPAPERQRNSGNASRRR